MRILVTGSRDWTDTGTIRKALFTALMDAGHETPVLVHGDCPTGADAIADAIWPGRVEPHPAEWEAPCQPECRPNHRRRRWDGSDYCPAQGVYRNQKMVDLGADVVLAFQKNGSHGTQDAIDRAEKAGIPVRRFLATQ